MQKGPLRGICDKRGWCVRKRVKLTFAAANPPPPHVFIEVALMEAEESGEYFWIFVLTGRRLGILRHVE
jgi:hypothetical protein